jgi:hypothetical protein
MPFFSNYFNTNPGAAEGAGPALQAQHVQAESGEHNRQMPEAHTDRESVGPAPEVPEVQMEDNGPPRTEGVRRDPSIFAIEEDIFAMDGDKSTTVWIISFSVLIGVLDEHVQNKRRRTNKDEVQQLVRPLQSKISKGVVAGSIHRMKTRTSALSTEIQRVQEAMTNMQAERADMLKSFEQWAAEKEKELVQQSNQLVE